MDRLKVGILGAGGIASRHAKSLSAIDGVDIVSVCDLDEARASDFCMKHTEGKAIAYTDFDNMLSAQDMDALVVALPPGAHMDQEIGAAKRGIHLFLEKPIALTEERGKLVADAVESSGIVSIVGFMFRFGPATRRIKHLVESGEAGRPTLFQGRYFCNSLHAPWWRRREMSGGQILEQIIHTYDLARFLFGEAVGVSAFAANLCHGQVENYSIEDCSASLIRFRNGAFGSIVGSNCAVPGKWINDLRLVFERMTVDFKDGNTCTIYHHDGKTVRTEEIAGTEDLFFNEMAHFLECVREKRQTSVPIQEGLRSLKLVSAVMKSADKGGIFTSL